jgi:hypothetical protein
VRTKDIDPHGFCCIRCGLPFAVGDCYSQLSEDAEVVEVVCLSCAAAAVCYG